MNFYTKSLLYFSRHPILNSLAHSAGGFGLALVLQQYLAGNAFLSPVTGWVLIAVSVVMHVMSFTME
jgi:hypothetical protein